MLRPALKAQILDSLAKVDSQTFVGDSIRIFCSNAHLKTDLDIVITIQNLQSQAKDNEQLMQDILGKQFQFINNLDFQ